MYGDIMRKVIWKCDKCGIEKADEEHIASSAVAVWEGWVTISIIKDGEWDSRDICPNCAENFLNM